MEIRGTIKNFFHNIDTSDFKIFKFVDSQNNSITCKGSMPNPKVGLEYELIGEFVIDKKYGRQFNFTMYKETMPTNARGIINYLSSGAIKGVGPKLAETIFNVFGMNTISVLDNNPELLKTVPGIGEKKFQAIKKSWSFNRGSSEIMMFLQGCDITPKMALKIYKTYEDKSREVIEQNPYQLIRDIEGIGFKSADSIAAKLGIPKDDDRRAVAANAYYLETEAQRGNCYATKEDISNFARNELYIGPDKIEAAIQKALNNGSIVFENGVYWLPKLLNDEQNVVSFLRRIQTTIGTQVPIDIVNTVIKNNTLQFSESQTMAIKEAIDNKIFILTGGPGTGKSTISKAILDIFSKAGLDCMVAAPTGRAAKRLQEATGRDAKTIHRLLEYNPSMGFIRNKNNPLECDVVLVDEVSMLDISLFKNLLEAIPREARLILVGDVDQLPSVGAGNVLRDMINSGVIPVRRLDVIFRQKEGSQIVDCADKINTGQNFYFDNKNSKDVAFYNESDPKVISDMVVYLVNKYINEKGLTFSDIQILYPQKLTDFIGTFKLNERLQATFNPKGKIIATTNFRVGDKVMQLKNNYTKEVFNGDTGYIESYDKIEQEFVVNFGDKKVVYDLLEHDELMLSYVCTVHKSQGSEYPYVIMLFSKIVKLLSCRNLLYTGVTRAKKHLDIIGSNFEINKAISNNYIAPRRTMLCQRLQGVFSS